MLIVYAFALTIASVLLIMFVAKVRNAPAAPKWATSKILLQASLFCAMTAFIFGIALLFDVVSDFATIQFGLVEGVLLVALFAASFVAWRKIRGMGKTAPVAKPESGLAKPGGMA